jgi:putative acetyltransferase
MDDDPRPTVHPAVIRPERPDDHPAIAQVVADAFGSEAEARLVDAIRASDAYLPELALVAELEGAVVGHVMISYVGLEDASGTRHRIASLSPLAVAPAVHRQGIGSTLVRAVTAAADERGEPLVVLEGDPAYYGRFGFEPSVPQGVAITLPSWASPAAAQLLRLREYDAALVGRVVYPPAFDEVAEH